MINNTSIQTLTEISTLECAEADAWFAQRELEAEQDERDLSNDDILGFSFGEIFEC